MRLAMLELIAALEKCAFTNEVMANELVEAANQLEDEPVAEVMRGLARRHRVEALQLKGRLAAATAEYDARYRAA